jgi:hypothetical protein
MSVAHDSGTAGKHDAKTPAFINELKNCIAKGPLKHRAVGGLRDNTDRGELKNVIRRIRGQLDVLDSAVIDASAEGLDVVSDRACHDIGELLRELHAIVRPGRVWGRT